MFTFKVKERRSPVNDKPRSPVMPVELHVNLAWPILRYYTKILTRVEQCMSVFYSKATGYS